MGVKPCPTRRVLASLNDAPKAQPGQGHRLSGIVRCLIHRNGVSCQRWILACPGVS